MPLSKLVFKPGINRDQTNYSSEGGWYDCDKIRFRSGYPEKMGGWVVATNTAFSGTANSLYAWLASNGGSVIGVATNEKMYVVAGGNVFDITAIRATYASTGTNNMFGTVAGSATVTVNLPGHGAITGDYVTFSGAAAVGGIPAAEINKEHRVFNATTGSFQFSVATAATSTVAAGGGTTIGAAFQTNVGFSTFVAGYGYGTGGYGVFGYGSGSTTPVFFPARMVSQTNFNDDLVYNIAGGDIFYWVYDQTFSSRAVRLADIGGAVAVPRRVTRILQASSGHMIALGCTNYDPGAAAPGYLGSYDPRMVRWSNVDADIGPEPENWRPTLTNNAGFHRISSGSGIVTGIQTRQEILIFTDISLHSMQFLGTSEVFGFTEMGRNVSIVGPNAVTSANDVVYWMGRDKFFFYTGRVETLPCTLRQYVFDDMNMTQAPTVFAGTNNEFNEVIWFYTSNASTTIDRYVVYNYVENLWYFGRLHRTAWLDSGVQDTPIAAANGWVYNHEVGNDDGQPDGAPPVAMESFIQSADVDIDDGDRFMLVRRVLPDVNFVGSNTYNPVTGAPLVPSADVTVGVRNFPGAVRAATNAAGQATVREVRTTATIDQYSEQVFIRCRGRQMSFRISSNDVGVRWQLGLPRVDARPDGTRG